jgi:hypothetical protein
MKVQGRETDHSFAYSAQVNKDGAINSLPRTSSWCGACLMTPRVNSSNTVVLLSEAC